MQDYAGSDGFIENSPGFAGVLGANS